MAFAGTPAQNHGKKRIELQLLIINSVTAIAFVERMATTNKRCWCWSLSLGAQVAAVVKHAVKNAVNGLLQCITACSAQMHQLFLSVGAKIALKLIVCAPAPSMLCMLFANHADIYRANFVSLGFFCYIGTIQRTVAWPSQRWHRLSYAETLAHGISK